MEIDVLTEIVIGCAIEVHRYLGPGLLESAYQECLAYELRNQGIIVEKEISLPIIYKEIKIDHGYRIDLLIENRIVIELKLSKNSPTSTQHKYKRFEQQFSIVFKQAADNLQSYQYHSSPKSLAAS